jgi:hypothetical protein
MQSEAQHNNGMHPTAIQRECHRELVANHGSSRRVMPGVRPLIRHTSQNRNGSLATSVARTRAS